MKKIVLLLILINFNLYSQSTQHDKTINGTTYQIHYNSKWKLDESGRNATEFYLYYSPGKGKFGSNINLIIQSLEGMNLNLDSYTEISTNQVKANGKLISSKRKSKANLAYQELIFEFTHDGYEVRCLQNYFLRDSKAYILTFTSLITDYDKLYPAAQAVMNNFKLK